MAGLRHRREIDESNLLSMRLIFVRDKSLTFHWKNPISVYEDSMNSASTMSKLAQLRAKTDQELSQIIDKTLESALSLLESAEPDVVRAEKAYAEAAKLLSKVEDPRDERRLGMKLVQVRESLQRVSTADRSRAHAAW